MTFQYQLLPDLALDEYQALKDDIARRGVQVPIEFDDKGNVLDGHHRLKICRELGIKNYPSMIRAGMSEAEKVEHVLSLNLNRRHLNEQQRIELHCKLREMGLPLRQIAEMTNFSDETVRRDVSVSTNVATPNRITGKDGKSYPATRKPKTTVMAKNVKEQTRTFKALAQMPTEELPGTILDVKRVEQLARERRNSQLRTAEIGLLPTENERYQLIPAAVCDLTQYIPDGTIDAIITDPPYPEEYLPVYADLAKAATRLLKPGAPLVVLVGQAHLPEICSLMAPHIKYLWCLAYLTPANTARVFSAKALVNWKPILVFSNGPYTGDWYADVLNNSAPDKRYHEWGQGESGFAALIERFTQPGQTVLDPFCGGSTTGAAALKMDRRYIGADLDPGCIAISAQRLAELL